MSTVAIRRLQQKEVTTFWKVAYGTPDAEWTKYNGPYFNDQLPTREEFVNGIAAQKWLHNNHRFVITTNEQIVGSVSITFIDGHLKRWPEIGIIIYPEKLWNQHIGTRALKLLIDYVFDTYDLPHVGLTTWSGNPRMIRLAERIGMQREACIRKVRYYHGHYYDSVKYGVLRSEWATLRDKA